MSLGTIRLDPCPWGPLMKSGVQMLSINCSSTTLVSIVEVKLRRLTCQEKLATWIVLHLGMENPTINETSHGSGRTLVSVQFSRGKHFGPNLAPANVLSKCATLAPPWSQSWVLCWNLQNLPRWPWLSTIMSPWYNLVRTCTWHLGTPPSLTDNIFFTGIHFKTPKKGALWYSGVLVQGSWFLP